MRYSICIIDDEIPASGIQWIRDTELLNSSNLEYLLIQTEKPWTDETIKNLIKTLLKATSEDGTSTWDVYGYTNPSFYINTLENGAFRADIVIFDWDYPGASSDTNSESLLQEILNKTFSLVFIFSKADKQEEIGRILAKPEFQIYKERLFYLDKAIDGNDQTTALLEKAEQLYQTNFSFRFAHVLRTKATQSMDKILSDMGKIFLNDVKNHIVIGDGGKRDFVDFITEKFRFALASKDIYELVEKIPEPAQDMPVPDAVAVKKMWSYRLYFQNETGDDLVRCGDVIRGEDAFYLVLSADCDLHGFWKKNLGIVNTVVLHELDQANITLKDTLSVCMKPDKISGKIQSLLGRVGELSEGPFVLPFVPIDGDMRNFLVLPKDLFSKRITSFPEDWGTLNEKSKSRLSMKYAYWPGAQRFCTVAEPFLTPVITHILKTIAGNGVPDYSDPMVAILKKVLEDFSKTPAK